MTDADLKEMRIESYNAKVKGLRIGHYLEQAILEIEKLQEDVKQLEAFAAFKEKLSP